MEDSNPLIRALALRTISYIHVREFVEATVQPVKQLMGDPDPYVRKTAAFCVAKLYEHNKVMVERSDLIDRLNRMLKDENPTVVSSVLAALVDIWGRSESISLTIDYASASKLVSILPDCSECEFIPVSPFFFFFADESTILQMESDVHLGSTHVICPTRDVRGTVAGRESRASPFAFERRRRTHFDPCNSLPHELYFRRKADHIIIKKAVSSSGHATLQATGNPVSGTSKRHSYPAEAARGSPQ